MDRLEQDVISWAPARAVFMRRIAINTGLTFVCFAIVIMTAFYYFELGMGWGLFIAAALALGFAFDDLQRWRVERLDRWQIADQMLIQDGPNGRAQVPLSEIESVKIVLRSRLIVRLTNGQKIMIRYLAFPDAIAKHIEDLRGPAAPSA